MREKIEDIIESTKGEISKILLEEATPVFVGEMLKGTVFEAATQAIGVAVPGVGNIMISYKQRKLERNFETYVKLIAKRQDEINERLAGLEKDKLQEVQSNYFGLIADYASEAKQEEKIAYMVNGFVNMVSDKNLHEDVILMYYDTLDQLSLLDLRVLRLYACPTYISEDREDSILNIMREYDLGNSQVLMIKEKLARLGLLESRNDSDMDENIKNMAQYLEDLTKGRKNPKLKKLKRISKMESFKITRYGREFFDFFTDGNG